MFDSILSGISSAFGAAKNFLGGGVGTLIGSGLSFLGGERQNEANQANAQQAMGFEAAQAQQNREFQEAMSRTAHQRQVGDLKAAGLNPILSGTGGGGAPQPTGAKGSGSVYNAVDPISNAVASAQHLRRNDQEIKNMRASERLTDQQHETEKWRTRSEFENIYLQHHRAGLTQQEWKSEQHRTNMLGEDYEGRRREGDIDRGAMGEIYRHGDRATGIVGNVLGGANSASRVRDMFRQRYHRPGYERD